MKLQKHIHRGSNTAHHYNKTIRDGRGVRTDVLLGRGKYGAPYSADNTIRVSEVEVALRPQDK